MPPTAASPALPNQPAGDDGTGKFVIIGILGLAIVAASGSWLFRYGATHRTARFWGPETVRLIRDAPKVTFDLTDTPPVPLKHRGEGAIDVSRAHGLAHLRNALLEDRNFEWPKQEGDWPRQKNPMYWWLEFEDPAAGKSVVIWFSQDCVQATRTQLPDGSSEVTTISTKPIASGLREIFAEFATQQTGSGGKPESATTEPANPAAR